jgi:predicted peptidase
MPTIPFVRAFVVLILALPMALAEEKPGFHTFQVPESKAVPATANRGYQLYVPAKAEGKLPLVVYLHGAGAKGTGTEKPAAEVLPKLLADPKTQKAFPCWILVPQCREGNDAEGRPNNWVKWVGQKDNPPAKWEKTEAEPSDQLQAAKAALEEVLATRSVDPKRVYLTGVSMGGSGSWYWGAREPGTFAAVLTACGLSEVGAAGKWKQTPLWAFHGSDDDVAPVERSRQMIEAVKKAGGTPKYTEFQGAGHNIAAKVLTDNDNAALKWLFGQSK